MLVHYIVFLYKDYKSCVEKCIHTGKSISDLFLFAKQTLRKISETKSVCVCVCVCVFCKANFKEDI